jgi:hypothetical protein
LNDLTVLQTVKVIQGRRDSQPNDAELNGTWPNDTLPNYTHHNGQIATLYVMQNGTLITYSLIDAAECCYTNSYNAECHYTE